MTTQDFWKSIKEIIDEDFTEQGLATLDNYAEQFITGRIVYKRFSQREQYGCAQGGATHVIASLLAAAEIDPNCITAPLGSFKREQIAKKPHNLHSFSPYPSPRLKTKNQNLHRC